MSPDHDALRAAAFGADPHSAAALTRLRRLARAGDADTTRAAVQLAIARRGAAPKFAGRAATLVADPEGVQQASSLAVAAHKALRFRDVLGDGSHVLDLCSGIGGDAIALREAGLRVTAIDHDPVRAWMTARNADVPAACADVRRLRLRGAPHAAYHIDPARRGDRGRIFRLADYLPPPAFLRDLAAAIPAGAIKLGPGVDLDDLRDQLPPGETEFISEAGRLVQAMQWTGSLARHRRTATLLPPAATPAPGAADAGEHSYECSPAVSLHGDAEEAGMPPISPMRRHLFTVDPAVERAGLIDVLCGQLAAAAIHPALGLLTSDRVLDSPWLTGFELLAEMPWRPPAVRAWLAERSAGIVEVKTRGKAVDPDAVQRQLRGRGEAPFTVFVLRWDQRKVALITRRIPA